MKHFMSIPVQLIAIILAVLFFGHLVPLPIIRGCYTFSLLFKEFLGLLLPFMVFFFVSSGIVSFKKNAPAILAILFGSIFLSNAIVAFLSYGVMSYIGPMLSSGISLPATTASSSVIVPYFRFVLPFSLNAVYMLGAAILVGLSNSFFSMPRVAQFVVDGKKGVEMLITSLFIPLLPLYILGFLLELKLSGTFTFLIKQYGAAFALILCMQLLYLLWLYLVAAGFSFAGMWRAIKTAFPSYLTAFSTMSSTAAIPVSVASATKNTSNPELSAVAMPIMANVHLLGDSIVTPVLAMVTLLVFTGSLPSLITYCGFVLYFCFSMFAVSGIPGGGLLVMIPVLKSQLGFTAEMISVITTIYFLLDSFGTGANVMGDGALVIIINKLLKKLRLA